MAYNIRTGHKLSGRLATQALTRNLDPNTAGRPFFGKLPRRAFKALKQDPKIAKHLSSVHKGFQSEVPEEIVHSAQEKLAQEKLVKYGIRKDSYKQSQNLLADLRKAEAIYKSDKKDAFKFLELGEKEFKKYQQTQTTPPDNTKAIKKAERKIESLRRLGASERAINKVERDIFDLKIQQNPKYEKRLHREQLNKEIYGDSPEKPDNTIPFPATPSQNSEKQESEPTDPFGPDLAA